MKRFTVFTKICMVLCVLLVLSGQAFSRAPSFETIEKGQYNGYTQREFLVIYDQAEWERVWNIHAGIRLPVSAVPEIDFTREMIIAVFAGQHSTGGHTITITTVETKNNSVRVRVQEARPGSSAIVTEALTQPYHIIKTAKTTLPVEFVTEGSIKLR